MSEKQPVKRDTEAVTDEWLRTILQKVKAGDLSVVEATRELSALPYEELAYAKIDHHRHLRTGFPEVIFGSGKTVEQIA